jgi:cytochrome b561
MARAIFDRRYTRVAIVLHWAIAALILFNLSVGFFMEGFAQPLRGTVVRLHVSSGITVLALTAVRVLWRLAHKPPPLPAGMKRWERSAAHLAHGFLYVLMMALPLTGWSIVSAHPPGPGVGARVWNLWLVPPIGPISHIDPAHQKLVHDRFVEFHSFLGWSMLALLVLHVAGALKHQFVDHQPELARMGLGRIRD